MKLLNSLLVLVGLFTSQLLSANIRYTIESPGSPAAKVEVPLSKKLEIPLGKSAFICTIENLDTSKKLERKIWLANFSCQTVHRDGSGGLLSTQLVCIGDEKKETHMKIVDLPKGADPSKARMHDITLECY